MEKESEKKGRPKTAYLVAAGVAVVVVVAAAAVFIYNAAFGTDQEKVDQATLELRSAAELMGVNDDLIATANDLSSSTALKARAKARSAQKQIDRIRGMSADQDPSADLTSALDDSESAAQGVERLAGRLIASSKLRDRATRDNADKLLRAQKGLRGLVGAVAIAKPLNDSMNALAGVIDEAVADLKDEDALSGEAEKNANATTVLVDERAQDAQKIEKGIKVGIEREVASLGDTRFDVTKVAPDTDCGGGPGGSALVLNSGSTTCEIIRAVDKARIKGQEPAGWTCGGLPISVNGYTADLATGNSCTNESKGITFSTYNRDGMASLEAQAAADKARQEASSGSGRCLDGYDWVHSYGVPNSGRCVVIEGDESEG